MANPLSFMTVEEYSYFAKAFDNFKLPHRRLLLRHKRVHTSVDQLMALSAHPVHVVEGQASDLGPVLSCVPQGSEFHVVRPFSEFYKWSTGHHQIFCSKQIFPEQDCLTLQEDVHARIQKIICQMGSNFDKIF